MIGWLEDDEEGEMDIYCETLIIDKLREIHSMNQEESETLTIRWADDMEMRFKWDKTG